MAEDEQSDILMIIDSDVEETSLEDPFESVEEGETKEIGIQKMDHVIDMTIPMRYSEYTVLSKYLSDEDIEILSRAISEPRLTSALKYNPNEVTDFDQPFNEEIETLHVYSVEDRKKQISELKKRVRLAKKKMPIKQVVLDFPTKEKDRERFERALGCPVRQAQLIGSLQMEEGGVRDARNRLRRWAKPLDPRVVEIDYVHSCGGLRRLDLSRTAVHNLDARAFYGQWYLEEVVLSDHIMSIGNEAFFNCVHLVSVRLPSQLTRIGNRAFWHCGIRTIELPSTLKEIGSGCFYGSALEHVEIPTGMTWIKDYTFKDCKQLRSVTLPSTLVYLGEESFFDCDLKSLTLPEGVQYIGKGCFRGCDYLSRVENLESVAVVERDAFWFTRFQRERGRDTN